MKSLHVKKGDTVIIRTGDDKGKKGKILKAFPKTGKVLVDGINVVKRHQKSSKTGTKGQMVEMPMPMSASNVAKE